MPGPTPVDIALHFIHVPGCENVLRTTYTVDGVPGVYRDGQVIHGVLRPDKLLDFTTAETRSESMRLRFGEGAGQPIAQDLTVGQAIVKNPDRGHALKGGGVNERVWTPQGKSIEVLGIDPAEWSRGQNLADYQFLRDLQERVIRPLDLGLPVGTDPALWDWEASGHTGLPGTEPSSPAPPTTSPPSPPVVAPPAQPPAGLSAPELRVDELFYGFVVHQAYPAVRPVLVELLKMARKATGRP